MIILKVLGVLSPRTPSANSLDTRTTGYTALAKRDVSCLVSKQQII